MANAAAPCPVFVPVVTQRDAHTCAADEVVETVVDTSYFAAAVAIAGAAKHLAEGHIARRLLADVSGDPQAPVQPRRILDTYLLRTEPSAAVKGDNSAAAVIAAHSNVVVVAAAAVEDLYMADTHCRCLSHRPWVNSHPTPVATGHSGPVHGL